MSGNQLSDAEVPLLSALGDLARDRGLDLDPVALLEAVDFEERAFRVVRRDAGLSLAVVVLVDPFGAVFGLAALAAVMYGGAPWSTRLEVVLCGVFA